MISILCPSRARPELCQRMIRSAWDTSVENIQVFVGLGSEDFESYMSTLNLPESTRMGVATVSMPDSPTAFKWQRLCDLAMTQPNKLFMLGADDMVFKTPGWDKAIIDHYNALPEGRKAHVYALQDSRDQAGTPHIIATREYIKALGFFVPPIMLHWYVDSWTVEIAKSAGCFTPLKDYELEHIKPSDQGQGDDTHNRIRAWGWRERDAYVAETCKDWLELQKDKLADSIIHSSKFPVPE